MSMAAFSAKDLALVLPDQVGDAFTMMHTEDKTALQAEDVVNFQPKIDPSKKIHRLRAGKAPESQDMSSYLEPGDDEDGFFRAPQAAAAPVDEAAEAAEAGAVRRRRSRWDSMVSAEPESVVSQAAPPERQRRKATVLDDDEDEEDDYVEGDVAMPKYAEEVDEDEEDEEAIAARRARIRERLRRQRDEEEEEEDEMAEEEDEEEEEEKKEEEGVGEPIGEVAAGATGARRRHADEETDEESEESEYETDTDDDSEEEAETQLLKPVFVHKAKRVTVAEREAIAAQEEEKAKAREAASELRKVETQRMVAEQIRREEDDQQSTANQNGNDSDPGNMPDDDDDADDEVEFEAWRLRELKRVARDGDLRRAFEAEKAETERRRGLSEAERLAEDSALGKLAEKPKEKWKFLQKYYHKGAFYMDETEMGSDDVRKRAFGEATLEDKFDKASMPKVMQVKKFGFAGRTKYTHLKDQDTTDYDSAWMQDVGKRRVYDEKLAGLGDVDNAGRKRAKK